MNDLNHGAFKEWAVRYPNVHLVSDGTTHNDNRLGATACLELGIKHFSVQDDLIVVGGYAR